MSQIHEVDIGDRQQQRDAETVPVGEIASVPEPLSGEEVKRRVRIGQQQKANAKRSSAKRVVGHINTALLTFATLVTCVTGHITEPARQLTHGAFEISQAFVTGGQERPSVLEVCAGEANTTAVFKEEGHRTCRPRDLIYGDDILDPAVRWTILEEVRQARPKLVIMGWPCRLWGTWQNVNYPTRSDRQELRRLRKREKPFLDFFRDLAWEQISRGDHIIGENPLFSAALEEEPIMQVMNWPSTAVCRTDMCSHGLRHPTTGQATMKPTALIVSHPAFVESLGRVRNKQHSHTHVSGAQKCKAAGTYTRLFGKRVVRALDRVEWLKLCSACLGKMLSEKLMLTN